MEESEDNMSAEEIKLDDVPIKVKPKKRSLVERELETSLTARITSPITTGDSSSTSRYGRARRLKSDADFCDLEKNVSKLHKSPKLDKSPSKVQSPAYKMHASNSPVRVETPKRESNLENQIENIYSENISLSRFGSEEKACKSATKKFPKVYIRKDLIQSKDKDDDTVVLIKNMFSPSNSAKKPDTHLANYLERSSEKNNTKKSMNGYLNTSSVVKTLDFDNKKKKKEEKKTVLSKSELFDLEAQCEYQVGDLTWARMGTYPFWPCIVTRDPFSGMFVKKKLFGRIERDVLHVTFFGDNGRRGWIVGSMLRKFLGQTEFEVARANFPPETKKKDPKLYAAFFISEKKIPQWQISVNEAEMLLREPKRLRIDILNDMLQNGREIKTISNYEKSKAIVRTNSDVSLSESLLDTLFSEDDSKGNDADRSRSKSRNRSFDVSEVVTACLDNMAAKTGITKIQRQSHMDRWLQKAKSKTPEKSHLISHLSLKIEKDNKVSKPIKLKKKLPKTSPANKHYNCRKIVTESQSENKLLPHQNEHDYSLRYRESSGPVLLDNCEIEYENAEMLTSDVIEPGSGLGFISKVETLCGQERVENNDQNDVVMTISNKEFTISDTNVIPNMNVANQICIPNNHGKSLDVNNEVVLEKENYMTSLYTSDSGIMQINKTIDQTKLETLKTIEAQETENDETLPISSIEDTHIATLKDLDYDVSDKIVLDGRNIDNEFSNECDTHIKTINNESDNNLVISVDQNISLMDVTIETEIVTDDKNGSISRKQETVSIIKQESSLNRVNSLDSDIVETVTPEKKSALKENLFKNNEVLKEFNCSEIKTLSNIANLRDDGIGENPDASTNISDENSKQASVMKENLLRNKDLELNDFSENNENNLSKQTVEVSNIQSMKTYADNEENFFPDIPNNIGEKSTGHTTSNEKIVIQENFVLNELNSNTSSENEKINTQIPEIPYVTNANECVDDEIDRFATDPKNSNKETEIKKDLILNIMSNPSTEKTSLSTMSLDVVNLNEYTDKRIENLPEKSNNISVKKNFEQTNQEKKTFTDKYLSLNQNLDSNSSTVNKLSNSITLNSDVSNPNLKGDVDGIKDFPDPSKTTEEKSSMECGILNKEIIEENLLLDKDLISQSLEVSKVTNLKEYVDESIEHFDISIKKIKAEQSTPCKEAKKNFEQTNQEKETFTDKYLSLNQNLDSNSSTVNKLSNSITLNSDVSNPNLKGDVDGIKDFPDPSKTTEEKSSMECGILFKEIIEENLLLDKDLISQSLEVSKVTNLKEYVDESIENFDISIKKIKAEQSTPCKEAVSKKKLSQNKELKSKPSNTARKIANRSTKKHKVTNVVMGSKEYGIGAFPNVSTNTGQKNQILESKSLRQNDRELKEFETQLYSIFGLKNENLPKCKLNLSLNKSCKKSSSTDVIKPIDNTVQINVDDEPECTSKVQENEIKKSVENDDASVNVMNVRPDVRKICTQRENSKDIVVNIESATSIEQTVENIAKNDIIAIETKGQNLHTACDMDKQTSSKENLENLKKNAFNNADLRKESVVEGYTDNPLEVDDNDRIDKNVMSSENNETSPQKINLPADHKLSYDIKDLENPDFVKYLELRQDELVDEQPELTQVEITNYLYKTWLYEENLKADFNKTDDVQNDNLVNGLKYSPIKIKLSLNKSSKSNKKSYKVEITNDNENNDNFSFSRIDQKIELNDNKNKNLLNQTESSPKRSKRLKRSNHYSTSFQKYFISSIKKDSHSNKVLELIPKECHIQENDNYPVKIEINAHVDTSCTDSASVSSNLSIQNGYNNVQIGKKLHCPNKTDSVKNQSPKVSGLVTQNGCHEVKLNSIRASLDGIDADKNFIFDDEEPLAAQQRLTFSKNQSACIADGETRMNTTEFKEEIQENDTYNVSVKSESSDNLHLTKKIHTQDKHSSDKRIPLEEPEFIQYLELKQDTVIDEHPELTKEEIRNYLYKTWLYEENLKNDNKKEDIETSTNLVKDLNQETAPVKRVRKKNVQKDKPVEFNLDSENMTRKEKSKRKIIKPYFYKEHFSDIEDDIEFFEIFKNTSKTPTPVSVLSDSFKIDATEKQSSDVQMIIDANVDAEFVTNEMDEAEEYFRQLTVPKPNLFKGLVREKVCEICEKIYNLIKCKGCHCMFHVDCVKKKLEVVETAITVRGRKKKKKTRGRKAKDHSNSLDSECQSDEKSQDLNASDEMQNTSVENKIDPLVIANADDFEAQLSVKLKELLENPENKEYESFSSADELDWNDIDYGECKVVDVLPRKKDSKIDFVNFKCNNCEQYDTPVCFVCKSALSPKDKAEHRQRCQVPHCHKYYHLECLDHWPQTQFNAGELSRINKSNQLVEALTCPRHVCHTCVCDDPRGCKTRFSGDKLARCVRCPATYHTFTKCLPAGTQILTGSHIICPRHYEHRPGKVPCHVNTGWCFICALGGTLICCEYCPTSFHAECLNIDPPEGGYMCEDCETGRLPLYGEMVWVKLGHYRWWPGMILHPSEIPPNILAVKHLQGEFVVRFFGQYDYYWVNRGRVFPFQEGDTGRISGQKSKIDAAFTMAMEHAQRACEILKTAPPNEEESMDIASSLLPPHYVKLKVNKPCGSLCGKKIDIEESSLTQCECDPNEFDPCGPYTQCLNRMLLTECGPTCRAGDRCNNRAFEKRLYPKMTPYRTPHRGWGLKTLEDIKAGQFVIEYVGELIDEEEFRRRMRRKHEVRDENFYYLTLDKERMIDAGPKGNLARFMNHSCEPNCETQKWTVLGDVRVGLFALYDIPANSELTFNYNLESTGIEKKQCMCGAKRCSGYIGEKPKQDDQPKKTKPGLPTKRTYKKRKNVELSPSPKPKQRAPRPYKPRELTEIEKDLLIIKNATNGMSSDSESSRLSIDSKDSKGLKRRRTEDTLSPSTKKFKTEKAIEENDGKYQEVLTEK